MKGVVGPPSGALGEVLPWCPHHVLCCPGVRLGTSFICDRTAWLILCKIHWWEPVSWLVYQNLPFLVPSWAAVNSEGYKPFPL